MQNETIGQGGSRAVKHNRSDKGFDIGIMNSSILFLAHLRSHKQIAKRLKVAVEQKIVRQNRSRKDTGVVQSTLLFLAHIVSHNQEGTRLIQYDAS